MASSAIDLDRALEQLKLDREDPDAWRILFRESWPRLFAIAYRELFGQRWLAEDAAQTALLKVFRDTNFPGELDADRYFRYLSTVTRNTCFDLRESLKRRAEVELEAAHLRESDSGDPEAFEVADARIALESAIQSLNESDQLLIRQVLKGRPRQELAGELGYSYSAIVVRLYRIRQKLRKELESKGFTYVS